MHPQSRLEALDQRFGELERAERAAEVAGGGRFGEGAVVGVADARGALAKSRVAASKREVTRKFNCFRLSSRI